MSPPRSPLEGPLTAFVTVFALAAIVVGLGGTGLAQLVLVLAGLTLLASRLRGDFGQDLTLAAALACLLLAALGSSLPAPHSPLLGLALGAALFGLSHAWRHRRQLDMVRLCLAAVVAVAGLVVGAWWSGVNTLAQGGTSAVPMQFNTACALLLGAASVHSLHGGRRLPAILLQLPVIVVAAASVAEELGLARFNSGEWLWTHALTAEAVAPGRMALNTATALLLGAVAIIAAPRRRPRAASRWLVTWSCAFVIVAIAGIVLASYFFDVSTGRAWGLKTPMAWLTAASLAGYGVAIGFLGSQGRWRTHARFWWPVLIALSWVVLSLLAFHLLLARQLDVERDAARLLLDAVGRNVDQALEARTRGLRRVARRIGERPADAIDAAAFRREMDFMAEDDASVYAARLIAPDGADVATWQTGAPGRTPNRDARAEGSPLHVAVDAMDAGSGLVMHAEYDSRALLEQSILPNLGGHGLRISQGATTLFARSVPARAPLLEERLPGRARKWTVQIWPTGRSVARLLPMVVLVSGLVSGGLLAMALRFASLARERAQHAEKARRLVLAQMRERARTRQHLHDREMRLQAILRDSTEGIITIDEGGSVLSVNPQAEQMFGYAAAELIGRNIKMLMPERIASQHDQYLQNFRDTGVAHIIGNVREVTGLRRDGREFPVELSVSAVQLQDGRIFSGILRDLSERRATESRLRETLANLDQRNRELQDFAFVASHDLQEPLRKIRLFLERLVARAAAQLDDQARDYLARSRAAADRMQILMDDLLAYSRVTAAARIPTAVNLNQLLADVIDDLTARLEPSGGRVHCDTLPTVVGDASQLRQLFQNLLGNAIKFTRPGTTPEVRISARRADGPDRAAIWEIDVADNGIGFDPKEAERIFAPFQRLHGRDEYEGTGIGLAIVRRIIERHHGSIRVSSDPGKGSVFTVVLPAQQDAKPGGFVTSTPVIGPDVA